MDVPKIFGRYQPIQVLGSGSGSRVMLVKDLLDGEERALKVLLDESGTEGFFREFELLAAIQHPQVIKVFDFGQDASGLRYFTMEYVPGRPLAAAVHESLSLARIHRIACQIFSALAAIHARGILHADLKPQNIFLVEEGDGVDRIKLLDFGLAGKKKDPGSAKRRGTPAYMAPEAVQGEDIDARSDLYAVGVILYELLAGETPFSSVETVEALIKRKISEPALSVLTLRPDCPPVLAKLIEALLERDPALRPQTAAEALKTLEEHSVIQGNAPSASSILLSGMPLVGRSEILAEVRSIHESVSRSSSGRLVLLTADSGGGKSRILQEIKGHFQREGQKLIEARGGDVRGEPPLRQLFRVPVKLEADTHKHLLSRYQTVVQSLFAVSPAEPGKVPVLPRAEALGFIDGLASFMLELAARSALVVLFDDLHLADPAARDMFLQLAYRLSESPLLIFATVDAGWLAEQSAFQEAIERPDVDVVPLEPLGAPELEELLGETFGVMAGAHGLAEQVVSATGGNPAMVGEILESLVDSGALHSDRGRWFISEEGAAEVLNDSREGDRAAGLLKRRLEPLTMTERELLSAAAVLGIELEEDALRGLAGGGVWVGEALKGLLRHNLLAPNDSAGTLRFLHPRLQGYLLQQLSAEQRRALHRRAGEFVLASVGASVGRPENLADGPLDSLARHFLAAGDLESGRTFGLLAAARAEHHQALRQALERYQQLLALAFAHGLPLPPDVQEKVGDLQLQLGHTEIAMQDYQALLESRARWEAGWLKNEATQLPWRARLLTKMATVYTTQGQYRQALELLDQVVPLIPTDDLQTRVQIAGERCTCQMMMVDNDAAEKTALEGLAIAQKSLSPWLLASTLRLYSLLANVCRNRHQLDRAEEFVGRGLTLAGKLPDNLSSQEAREVRRYIGSLYFLRGIILMGKGEFPESIQATLEALGRYEALRDLTFMARCYNNIGIVYFNMGEWAEAIDQWERLRDLAERMRSGNELFNASNNLGFMYKETGQLEKAGATFEECLRLVRKQELSRYLPIVLGNLGEVRAREMNFPEARRLYEQAVAVAREQQNQPEIIENLRRTAELSLEEERYTRVRKEVHEGLELARQNGLKQEEANLLAVQGSEAAQRGLTDRALACFRQGDDILKDLKADMERARLKYRQGLAFNKLGFPSEAESALRFAEETFRRFGAAWDLRRTRTALQTVGGGDAGGGGLAFKKLQLLLDVTRSLGSEIELEPLLDRILEKAVELTHTERGFVILLDEKGNPTFHSTRRMGREDVEAGETAKISSTVIQRVVSSGTALAVTNIDQEFDLRAQASIVALGLRSIMCAPLKRGEKVLGVIYVDSSKITEGFYQADVSLLEALADAAAICLENAQLVSALRRKTDLMSILAHEFRSPITASITFAHQLLRDSDRFSADQRDNLEAILEQNYRLSRMISNILELARMEANRVEWWMEELEIDQVLTSTVRGLDPLAREKNVQVVVKPGPRVSIYGNPDRLIQVCTNLLGNSLKFTPERGKVEISTDVIEVARGLRTRGGTKVPAGESWVTRTLGAGRRLSDTSYLAVRFTDTGPGIPPQDLERIFGRFAQSGDDHARGQGTGLGLTIAREIVTQHGGRMWAENTANAGAMFVFCLPLVVPA